MDRESDFLGDVAKIAAGIFFGGLLLWMAFEYRARYELRQAEIAIERSTREMQREAVAAREREQRQRAAVQARQRDEVETAAARARAQQAAEHAKQQAWERFYQPSAECRQTWSVECGNAHIRARREFEQLYASGRL